jgi:hypothetical protein
VGQGWSPTHSGKSSSREWCAEAFPRNMAPRQALKSQKEWYTYIIGWEKDFWD